MLSLCPTGLDKYYNSCRLVQEDHSIFIRTLHTEEEIRGARYLLTNWLAYLYGRIQSPRPDVMPDRREGIKRAAGFGFACIDTQAS